MLLYIYNQDKFWNHCSLRVPFQSYMNFSDIKLPLISPVFFSKWKLGRLWVLQMKRVLWSVKIIKGKQFSSLLWNITSNYSDLPYWQFKCTCCN
jgi:hypothetical protein